MDQNQQQQQTLLTQAQQQQIQEQEYFTQQKNAQKGPYETPIHRKSTIPFDYSQCTFECRVKKKKMIGFKTKYVYMKDNYLIICNEPYKKFPDKIITLMPNMKVIWLLEKKTPQQIKSSSSMPPKIIGFKLRVGKDEFEYKAEEVVIQRLKDSFSQMIFQVRFQDHYEVLAQIGKGNYARVFSIKHRVTGQRFACKCFEKKKLINMDKGIASLYNELKVMRAVSDHENVIKLYEVYEGENTFYFVMEISEGPSLYDEIKKHAESQFTDESIYYIMKSLVMGINYCAKKGIMHRDLKPENLLFRDKDSHKCLKVVDFGLAAFQDDDPYIFPKCGTPGFVAPEIANLVDKTVPYDPICDVFSIGVVFHILLTGDAVFPGKKFNEVLKKNKDCKINLGGSQYEFIAQDAKDLLAKMLQKDPRNRITSEKALKHPYFLNREKPQRRPSYDNISSMHQQQQQQNIQQDHENRPKQKTLFTKPLRLPYVNKQEGSVNINDDYSGNGSFVTQDPLFKHRNQDKMQASQDNQSMSGSPFNSPYQVQGMMSPTFTFTNQQDGGQNPQDAANMRQRMGSKFSQGAQHKDSIQEYENEDESPRNQQRGKKSSYEQKTQMEEEKRDNLNNSNGQRKSNFYYEPTKY